MKTLIAVPCMDTVQTLFFMSMEKLRKPEGTKTGIVCSSLIYDARNRLSATALNGRYDRVLWLDSDMVFEPDLLERLSEDLDEGREFVCALFFTRKTPIHPVIYKTLGTVTDKHGEEWPKIQSYDDYPKDSIFPIQGCGFGAVMMTSDLIRRIGKAYGGQPFTPIPGFGEDFAFCLRARELGTELWCDSRIKVGHAGVSVISEETWQGYKEAK